MGLVVFFPAWVMVYYSRHRGGDVSYIEVPGTVTAKQDGWTDIGMARQILRLSEKYVCGWAKVSLKGAPGAQESIDEYELFRTLA